MLKRVMSQLFVEFFCLTVPKNAVGETFIHSLISDIEEVWMRGWWGGGENVEIFRRIILVSQCRTKKFVGQSFRVSLILGIEKFYA